jgi:hypothetical protein
VRRRQKGRLSAFPARRHGHSGQLAFDFQPTRAERAPARVVSLPTPPPAEMTLFPPERAQQIAAANHALAKYFLEGAELDDREERDLEAAAAAYRRAVLFDSQLSCRRS